MGSRKSFLNILHSEDISSVKEHPVFLLGKACVCAFSWAHARSLILTVLYVHSKKTC